MLARKCKRLLAMLLAMVMCLGLVSTSALAAGSGNPVIEEYHFMDRGQMNAYFLGRSSYNNENKLGEYYVERMWLEAGDKQTPEAVGIDIFRNMYNQTAKLVNDPTYHIQPDTVTSIKVAFAYWHRDGWLWKLERETLDFAYDEFDERSYGGNFVELYVKGTIEVPDPEMATVTFDAKGGSEVAAQEVVVGQTATRPTDPTMKGHSFVRWVDENGDPFEFTTPITENITLYAEWNADEPEPSEEQEAWFFIRSDGTIPFEDGTGYLASAYSPAHPDKGGSSAGMLTGTLYEAKPVYVDYNGSAAGVNPDDLDMFAPVSAAIKTAPSAEQIKKVVPSYNPETQMVLWYVVKAHNDDHQGGCPNWHVDGVICDKDKVYVGLTYDANLPSGVTEAVEVPASALCPVGSQFTVGSPNKTTLNGYVFAGWKDQNGNTYQPNATITVNENTTLYAQWTPTEPQTGTLYIKKSVAGLPGDPGVPADYDVTITVTNDADGTVYTLTGLEDNDPDTITANNSEWGEIPGGTYFYWKLENIPAGQYTVQETEYSNDFVIGEKTYGLNKTEMTDNGNVTVAADGESWVSVTNTYGFKDDDGEPVGPNPTEKLYFSKRVNTISAKVGDELTYTIQVHNDSSQAATVTISDPLDAGLTYVSNNAGAAYDETTNTVSWTGEVDSGKTFELVIVAKINDDQADKTISNEAYVNQAKTNLVFTEVKAVDPDPTPTPTTTPTPTPTPTPTTPPTTPGGDGDGDDDIIVTVNPRPTPSEEPGIDIPEETTPLGPNPEPSEEPGIDIPEETTPLGPGPDDGSGDEDGTDIDLPDGETPLGNLPQTGAVAAPVNPTVTMGLMALAFSMAGCGLYFTFGRKKGEEED